MDAIKCILFLFLFCRMLPSSDGRNVTSRPNVVNIGALLTFDSYIGGVAKIAIEQAVNDVNANSSILPGTKLVVAMHDSKCSGFIGMVEALRFMENDVMAIIGPQSSVVSHIISHVANELQVPLVSFSATDPTLSSLQFPFFVRTTHSDLYQMAAVADIVEHYGWKQVIAIYIDNDFGRNGVAALGDKLSDRRFKIAEKFGIPESGVSRANIMDYLVKVALLESRVIVLHVYPELGFNIFSVAKYLGMMGKGYVWIATDWLSTVLDSTSPLPGETMDTMQGVLVLRQHVPDSDEKKAFTSRWNKLTGGSPGLNYYGLHAYDSVWLVAQAIDAFFNQGGTVSFSNDSRLRSLGDGTLNLKALSIFDGGRLLLSSILQGNLVGLTGLLKFNADGALVFPAYDVMNIIGTGFRQIGYWSNYSGLTTSPPEMLYSGPANRSAANQKLLPIIWPGDTLTTPRGWVFPNNGKQLKIGVPDRVSFREFVSRIPGTNSFKGFCIDVFTAAVNLLPYAVPYQFVPDGDGKSNPSYTELVNKITTGDLDAVVGDIAIVTNRTKIVDFTQPYAASGLVVVAPFKRSNTGAWAFLTPFSMPMWIVTSCCFLGIGIVVWILEHRINDEFRGPPKRQIITVLWFSLSTLFFAHRENTMSTLGRLVLIIWLFVVLIINSSYTASLTSILTVQQLSSSIKGIETLKNSDEPIGYQVGSFAEYYLSQELGIPTDRLIPLGSPEAFVKALQKGPKNGGVAALVDERPYVELFLSSQCSFRIVGEEFTKGGWGFVFPRDSPLAVDLSTAILQLSESGDLQRIHDKWLSRSSCSLDTSKIDSNRLHLQSFWGLFLLCGLVCFLALFIYFWQMVHQLYRNNREESTSAGRVSFRSGRHLQRLISLMDEKHDPSKGESKKRKLERSLSENDRDAETGRNVKGK